MGLELSSDGRLHRRLGDLARRRRGAWGAGARTDLGRSAPPDLCRTLRTDPGRSLPGCETVTSFGSLQVHEFVRGARDPGYGRLLAEIAGARRRLAEVPDDGLTADFLVLKRCGFERVLLLDLETGGLAGNPIFLAGLLTIGSEGLRVRQLLARRYPEEPAVLAEAAAAVAVAPLLVTYNGKSFDVPMLADRASRHRLLWDPPRAHLDLLHHARRAYRSRAPNCRLLTLEWAICHRRRLEDVASWEIPGLLHRFARDGDPSAVIPVLHHNALDLVTLAELLAHLVPFPPGPRFVPEEELAEWSS